MEKIHYTIISVNNVDFRGWPKGRGGYTPPQSNEMSHPED